MVDRMVLCQSICMLAAGSERTTGMLGGVCSMHGCMAAHLTAMSSASAMRWKRASNILGARPLCTICNFVRPHVSENGPKACCNSLRASPVCWSFPTINRLFWNADSSLVHTHAALPSVMCCCSQAVNEKAHSASCSKTKVASLAARQVKLQLTALQHTPCESYYDCAAVKVVVMALHRR